MSSNAGQQNQILDQNLAFIYSRDPPVDKVKASASAIKPTKCPKDFWPSDSITSFSGDYRSFDPTFECEVYLPPSALGDTEWNQEKETYLTKLYASGPFKSFEHALQMSKVWPLTNEKWRMVEIVKQTSCAREVKRGGWLGNHKPSPNWREEVKSKMIGECLLRDKFIRNKEARLALISTGNKRIYFANSFNDQFWGVNTTNGEGQNLLGILLEKIRGEIKNGEDLDEWLKSFCKVPMRDDDLSSQIVVQLEKRCAGGVDASSASASPIIFKKSRLYLGKSQENDIVSDNPSVSRAHAIILIDSFRGLVLIDLNSANGTFIDGERIKAFVPMRIQLKTSRIRLGASSRDYIIDMITPTLPLPISEREENNMKGSISSNPAALLSSASDSNSDLTVYVNGLNENVTESSLRNFFASCGNITSVSIPRDKQGVSKGIAFVSFDSIRSHAQALSRDGDELGGKLIKVKRALSSAPESSSSKAQKGTKTTSSHSSGTSAVSTEPESLRSIMPDSKEETQSKIDSSRGRRGDSRERASDYQDRRRIDRYGDEYRSRERNDDSEQYSRRAGRERTRSRSRSRSSSRNRDRSRNRNRDRNRNRSRSGSRSRSRSRNRSYKHR